MERYRNLWLWMLIPMAIMQVGIFHDYWGDFSQNAWSVHVHYWTATLWYLFLIIQPYFATHGQMAKHRTNGIVGMFLAGGVAMTAISMLHRDIASAEQAAKVPARSLPPLVGPWFFYGVIVIEIVIIAAFVFSVIQAIRHRRSLIDHAWWLVSTVFTIMMPALSRGFIFLLASVCGFSYATLMGSIYLSQALIIALILWTARKFGEFNHPATRVAIGVNLFVLLLEPIGRSPWVQEILAKMIRD
jgi:hypothetical protein